jgi:hypothetical protein
VGPLGHAAGTPKLSSKMRNSIGAGPCTSAGGGSYHWRILAGDGSTLRQSGDFASYDAAEQAARQICRGAASARFQRRESGTGSVDLVARRAGSDDHSDVERWLDEGGSFSSEAVAQWPAPR